MRSETVARVACVALTLTAVAAAGLVLQGCSEPEASTETLEILSPVYTVDKEYRSMMGPSSTQTIRFPRSDPPELLWITGYRAVMVGEDGESTMPQDFMCHSNLDFDSTRHAALMNLPLYHTGRLFTLSQGQQEIEFPRGFGLPYYSDEEFELTTQVLNLNFEGTTDLVRHKVSIDYVFDRDLTEPMKPLFMTSGWGLVLLEGESGHWEVSDPTEEEHGPGCLPGTPAAADIRLDSQGREFSGHWVVPPGREVNRTLVTKIMNLPYDTKVHYIAVHLHPFAESLELVDLTDGKTVFKSGVDGYEDKIGIERVDYFSSEEGIPVYKDHEYEMISVYNNTTDTDQDSMAVMLLYLEDKRFQKGVRRTIRQIEGRPELSSERIVLETTHGDMEIGLYPDVAPNHVEQMLKLADAGVFDTTSFFRIDPGFLIQTGYPQARSGAPLTDEQKAAIRPIDGEFSDVKHRRGTVSMVLYDNNDPNSAEASFCIMLGDAPHMDGRYTVLGEITEGLDTLDRIEAVPIRNGRPAETVEIRSARVE